MLTPTDLTPIRNPNINYAQYLEMMDQFDMPETKKIQFIEDAWQYAGMLLDSELKASKSCQ